MWVASGMAINALRAVGWLRELHREDYSATGPFFMMPLYWLMLFFGDLFRDPGGRRG
jgi:hypothetical protein